MFVYAQKVLVSLALFFLSAVNFFVVVIAFFSLLLLHHHHQHHLYANWNQNLLVFLGFSSCICLPWIVFRNTAYHTSWALKHIQTQTYIHVIFIHIIRKCRHVFAIAAVAAAHCKFILFIHCFIPRSSFAYHFFVTRTFTHLLNRTQFLFLFFIFTNTYLYQIDYVVQCFCALFLLLLLFSSLLSQSCH